MTQQQQTLHVVLEASRKLSGAAEDAKRYEFEFTMPGPTPVLVSDCRHVKGAPTQAAAGGLPKRPCPLVPRAGAVQYMCTAPQDCGWQGNDPQVAPIAQSEPADEQPICPQCVRRPVIETTPATRFDLVQVDACVGCEHAGESVVGLQEDRRRVLTAFHLLLLVEDFTGFDELSDDDRDVRRWVVSWSRVQIR